MVIPKLAIETVRHVLFEIATGVGDSKVAANLRLAFMESG